MRNHLILLTTILFCSITALSAQQTASGTVKGVILDEATQQPLSYATVTLFNSTDSTLVTGGVTDDAGIFTIEDVPNGNYYAEIDFIGYKKQAIADIRVSGTNAIIDLKTLSLSSDAATLQEIEVRAEKSTMQMALDKRIFNVGKDLANIGGTALQLLDNVPSITVDVEGNVSLRGSGGVRILINGKPSGLVGNGDSDGLRNIPANLIDRIEVITNPSSRYEAEGMAGIINIILKKENQDGINGSFDLTAGYPNNYGGAANVNWRKNKLNLFANYGLYYRKNPGGGQTYQRFYNADTLFLSQRFQDRERGGWSNSLRAGLDYYFNPTSILTTAITYRYGKDENFSEITYKDYLYSLDNPTEIAVRRDDEVETEPNLEYALTYRKEFKRKGQEFVADVRFQDNYEEENSNIREQFYTPEFVPANAPDLLQRSFNAEGENELIIQLDYVHPISKEGRFEVGTRASVRGINNDYRVEEFADNSWGVLPGLTNEFNYDENIYAAYGIFGEKWGKFSTQVGLRAEYSDVTTELIQTGEINPRDYFNVFPSAFVSYDLPQQNAIQVSYSRRIRRPNFRDLNPFFTFSDARNFFSGNPNLNPEFTDSYEITHIKYWDKASFTSSVYYRHTEGVVDRIRRVDDKGNTTTRPENLLTANNYGAEVTFSTSPFEWWDMNGNVNFFRSQVDGGNLGPSFRADTYTWFARMQSKLDIFDFLDAQLSFNYRAPRKTTQGRDKSQAYVDLGLSKDILNSNGTLTLSVRDLFNSRLFRSTTIAEGFYSENEFRWRARQVTLTFNYRLNQQPKRERGGRGEGGGGGEFDGGGGDF